MTDLTPIEAVEQLTSDQGTFHAIVHGPASGAGSTVATEGGTVPTLANAIGALEESATASAATATAGAVATAADRVAVHADKVAADADAVATAADNVASAASAATAGNWATQVGAFVTGTSLSAKEWAVGTFKRGVAAFGSAKDWAILTGAVVDDTGLSAKEWAIGVFKRGVAAFGSAKDWAILTGAVVDDTGLSAKEWAIGVFKRGVAAFGSAKDWATLTAATVDNADYSAKEYAVGVTVPAGSSKTWATAAATSATGAASSASTAAGLVGGASQNLLIDGAFTTDLLNSGSSTAISDVGYGFDAWYILTQTAAVNVSQLSEPEDGHPFAMRLTQNQVAAQRMGFAQVIEGKDCKKARGQSGTLQVRVRISNSQAIRYAIIGWTGTEDSVTKDVVATWTSATYTAGNFFTSTNTSVLGVGSATPAANTWTTLTALTAALGSTFKNLIVFVWTEATAAQNVTLDADMAKLEIGTTATAFIQDPEAITERRLRRLLDMICGVGNSSDRLGVGQALTSGPNVLLAYTRPKMRIAPTATASAASDFGALNAGGTTFNPASSITINQITVKSMQISIADASLGVTAGNASVVSAVTTTARITLDARI